MKQQQLLGYMRRALEDYHMIGDGDRIAVGVSAGKDSLTLLYGLVLLSRFYPQQFTLEAITVDPGYEGGMQLEPVREFCERLGVHYTVIPTRIAEIVFQERKETNPCSLCANLRKGAFNRKVKELGCNKVAYAHHFDDMVDTFMMSLIYEGRLHCYAPVTYLDRSGLTLIRPLMYVREADIISFTEENALPVQKNPCPVDKHTKREYVKQLLAGMEAETPGVRERVFRAVIKAGDTITGV